MSFRPWEKQEALIGDRGKEMPSQKQLIEVSQKLKEGQERVLFLLTYITAGRISEVVELQCNSIQPVFKEGRNAFTITMPNRKNKHDTTKIIPIPLDRELEAAFIEPVYQFVKDKTGRIFRFKTPARAWQILGKVGYNPHFLRHVRLTHMETIYGLSSERLRNYAGWTDNRPATHYVKLNWGDILDGM